MCLSGRSRMGGLNMDLSIDETKIHGSMYETVKESIQAINISK